MIPGFIICRWDIACQQMDTTMLRGLYLETDKTLGGCPMRRLLPVAFFLFVTALTLGGTVVHADSDAASGLVPVRQGDAPMLKIIPRSTDLAAATPYVYKHVDGVELKLYVFEPLVRLGDEPVPAVIFFFGGAWTAGRVEQFVPQSEYLAMRGLVAIVADYRVALRHGSTWFDSVRDAKSAIRWVREHAAELGIDPDRIVAAGGSAGGHLAAAAALVEGYDDEEPYLSARPDALVLFNPALDLTAFPVPAHWRDRAIEISPLHLVREGAPPTLIMHGTADATVPFVQAAQFCEAMMERGNRCELEAYIGRGHGFFNYRGNAADFVDTLQRMERFLVSLGYLEEF